MQRWGLCFADTERDVTVRRKVGNLLITLGALCILASLALLIYGQREAAAAAKASAELMPRLIAKIEEKNAAAEQKGVDEPAPEDMSVVTIDGQDYIGYLVIPELSLELPVMADWSYEQLHTAPCRFSGTLQGNNLVLMAHNYIRHFGPIQTLTVGDAVYFRDADDIITEYAVAAVETLSATDVEKMTAGEYELTLFTCTYGGQSRVTVRCSRA